MEPLKLIKTQNTENTTSFDFDFIVNDYKKNFVGELTTVNLASYNWKSNSSFSSVNEVSQNKKHATTTLQVLTKAEPIRKPVLQTENKNISRSVNKNRQNIDDPAQDAVYIERSKWDIEFGDYLPKTYKEEENLELKTNVFNAKATRKFKDILIYLAFTMISLLAILSVLAKKVIE